MAKMRTRKAELREECAKASPPFYFSTYSPGDGITRFRFFTIKERDYFSASGSEVMTTVLSIGEAESYAYAVIGTLNRLALKSKNWS